MIQRSKPLFILIIIDVRDPVKFNVSHLPKATNVTNASKIDLPTDTQIVVYCSVGIGSAKFA